MRKTLQTAGGSRPGGAKLQDQAGSLSEKILLYEIVALVSTNTIALLLLIIALLSTDNDCQFGQLPHAEVLEYFAVVGE